MSEHGANETLAEVLRPVLAPLGLALYDVELAGAAGRSRTLRVLVERTDGAALDLDAITAATDAVSPALDADSGADRILRGAYTLEVSSPGLERPLRTREHWQGAVGEAVSVKLRVDGSVERWRGGVARVDDDAVVLDVDGAERRVALADVTQARTVFEWGAQDKPGRSRAARRKQKVSP
jgi:ribosome maturation factor RimP